MPTGVPCRFGIREGTRVGTRVATLSDSTREDAGPYPTRRRVVIEALEAVPDSRPLSPDDWEEGSGNWDQKLKEKKGVGQGQGERR